MAKKRVKRKVISKKSRSSSKVSSNIPTALKVIAILFFIASVLHIIGALLMLFGGIAGTALISALGVDKILQLMPNLTQDQIIVATVLSALLIIGAIVMFALGILEYYVGRGLMRKQVWARNVAAIIIVLGLLKAITILVTGHLGSIITLIVYGIVGWYLLFDKNVKKVFN